MSLIDDFKVECCRMIPDSSPDGEGGANVRYTEGEHFFAAVVLDNSTAARIAEKQGLSKTFNVTADREIGLRFHDVIKRLADNRTFRITSESSDARTPLCASFSFSVCKAEEWELPT